MNEFIPAWATAQALREWRDAIPESTFREEVEKQIAERAREILARAQAAQAAIDPKYTDAQIEEVLRRIEGWNAADEVGDMLRSLLSERQAAMQGQGGELGYTKLPPPGWIPCNKCKRVGHKDDCVRCGGSGWRMKCRSLDCLEYGCCGGTFCYISKAKVAAELARQTATQPVRSVSEEDAP